MEEWNDLKDWYDDADYTETELKELIDDDNVSNYHVLFFDKNGYWKGLTGAPCNFSWIEVTNHAIMRCIQRTEVKNTQEANSKIKKAWEDKTTSWKYYYNRKKRALEGTSSKEKIKIVFRPGTMSIVTVKEF